MSKNPFEGLDRNNPADVLKAAEVAGITRYELRKMSPMMNDYLNGNNGQSNEQEEQPGVISDLWSSFGVGAGNLVKAAGSLYGLATGDMDNGATRLGGVVTDYWQKEKSNVLKELEQGRKEAITNSDSELGSFGNAIWETVSNPRLFASFVSEQIPMFVAPGGAGAAGARAGTSYAAKKGTQVAAQRFGSKVGTGLGVGVGAAMQGGDVGANTYDDLIALPEPIWEQNPEYLSLKDELGDAQKAKEQIALDYGRKASAISGALSVGSQFIPGGATVEKAMAGNKFTGGLMGRVAKGFAGEGAQEIIEEGGGKVISNSFIDNIDENQGLFEGVGESSGLGLLGGGVMGGTMAAISGAPNIESTKQQYEAKLNQLRESGKKAVAEGDTSAAQQIDNDFKQTQAAYTEFLKEYDPGFVSTNLNKQQQAKADKAAQGGDALDQELAAAQAASTIADDVAKDSQVKMEAQQGLMGGMNVWQPNFTMPGSEQEQARQVDGEYIANTDFPNSVPLGNTLGFDESVGAIDAMPENRINQSDTIFTGEQREELPAPQRLGLPDKYTNTIQGQDRTAELDAQEQIRQAQNAPRQIEQKDIVFGEDNRFRAGTDRATVRSNGNPFPTVKSVQASRSYRDAVESGINPEIVKVDNGFGWETNDDIEATEAPQVEEVAPITEQVQSTEQAQSSQSVKPLDINTLNETVKKGLLSRVKYLKSEESLDNVLQQAAEEGADSESLQEIQSAVDLRKAQLRGDAPAISEQATLTEFNDGEKISQPPENDTLTEDNQSLRELEPQEVAEQQPPEGGFFTPDESEVATEQEIQSEAPSNQEDWGEEIKTARKNISVKWSENSTDDEISSKPLSKTWPEGEFDDVGDSFASAFAFAARSEIPRKPNQSYKKQRWVEKVKNYRQLVKNNVVDGLLAGNMTAEELKAKAEKYNLSDFFAKVDVLNKLDRKDWGKVERVLSYPDADTPTTYVRINGRNREVSSTDPQVIAEQIRPFLEEATAKPQMKFEVRGRKGSYSINKKGDPEYTGLATFDNTKDAFDFIKNNNSKLVEAWESHKQRVNVTKSDIRNKENKPRTGEDYRQGKDATAEDFQEKFGIKRGTFGKWVKQGKERQDMLNGTYDALMDLSNITGVPPKALSLEGKLGFAFGANGRGKAMAHYEPGEVVINLTKTKGAGSLAHEWFHALDNYFQKKRDTSPSTDKGHYITHNPETYYVGPGNYTVSESRFKNMRVADESKWRKVEGVRPEVAESFKNLVDTLNGLDFAKRSSRLDKGKANGYWSSNLEMAARAFESYVKAKMAANGYDNDFLANITSDTDFVRDDNRYPYIKADEIAEVEAAFDDLFNTIESKETESGNVALFSATNNTNPTTTGNRTPISSADANKVIDSIISSWTGGIKARRNEFVVAPTFDDLPSDIKDAAKKQGAEGKVYGVFHNGKTYVVLDKHNSTQELETTIFHETYGHHGMRKLFGNEITQKMNQLFVANGGISGLRKAAEKHGIDLRLYEKGTEKAGMSPETRNRVLMEELLAHMQQDNKPSVKRMAKEVVGYIRQKLRDLGFAKLANLSDSDLFYLLKQSRDAVRKGSVGGSETNIVFRTQANTDLDMSDDARMQRARDMGFDTETVYYHGTKSSFDSFSKDTFNTNEDRGDYLGEAFYFSPSPKMASDYATWNEDEGANVIPVYLKMENPLIINGFNDYLEKLDEKGVSYSDLRGMSNAEKASKIKSLGYDGLVDKQYGQVAVFEPEQIRSTNAAFDPREEESGNIMFRTREDSAPQSFTAPIEKKWSKDWFKRQLQDKFAPIKDMQASIEGVTGQALPEDQDTYRAEELFYGKTENDLNKMEDNHVKPLVDAMTQNNIEAGELDQYLMAKHAEERNAHIASINPEMPDGGSGMTNAEAAEILSRYEQEGKLAGLSIAANEVYKITAKRRQILRESGLEDEALLDVWDAGYQFYVPLKGFANDSEGNTIAKTGKGFDIRGKESMKAMGRRTMAESPTAHAIQDLSATIIRARKNEVAQTFLNMVESNPNPEIWEVFTDENPDTFRHNIDGEVRSRATHPEDGRLKNQDLMKMRGEKKDDYFAVKVDGKTKYIKLKDKDGLLMEAMKNMGPAQVNGFTKAMGAATRWLSMVNTSLNPEFTITNFTRDIQTALFNALAEQDLIDGKVKDKQIAGSMVKGTGKAVGALYKHARGKLDQNDPMYTWIEEFLADGAKTGYFDSKDVDQIGKDMSSLLDMTKGTNKGKLLKAKKTVGDFVENINGSIENGVRLSAYIEARRAGVSRNKAASFAKNLTVNFNRKGSAGTFLNSVYMFFNAAVQGNVNFARAILTPKVDEATGKKSLNKAQKIAAGIVGASFGWASLMREIGGEDEDGVPYWDKIPKGVRERSFVILKPGTDGEYFKIPLPYGYNIFYNIGDAMEAAVQSDTRTKGDLAAELALSAYASFIPLGSPVGDNEAESAALVATPTLFKPIVEIATNKNFFGGQIYRENMPYGPELRDSQMSMRSTGEMYKGIARWMNDVMGDGMKYKVDGEAPLYDISPDTIEHIVEFGLGGLYRFGSRMADTVGTVANGGDLDVTSTPFIRQVNGEIRPYEDISNFYDARQELKNIEAELKSRKGKARMEFMQEYRDKYRLRGLMSSIDKRMKLLRKQRDRIEIDDSLSFVEREERLQRIEDKMKSAVATFNEKWNETE